MIDPYAIAIVITSLLAWDIARRFITHKHSSEFAQLRSDLDDMREVQKGMADWILKEKKGAVGRALGRGGKPA